MLHKELMDHLKNNHVYVDLLNYCSANILDENFNLTTLVSIDLKDKRSDLFYHSRSINNGYKEIKSHSKIPHATIKNQGHYYKNGKIGNKNYTQILSNKYDAVYNILGKFQLLKQGILNER